MKPSDWERSGLCQRRRFGYQPGRTGAGMWIVHGHTTAKDGDCFPRHVAYCDSEEIAAMIADALERQANADEASQQSAASEPT